MMLCAKDDSGCVLLPVVGLLAALALLILGHSQQLLDSLRLMQDRQQVVQAQVRLENTWQCQWWYWQHEKGEFPNASSACRATSLQAQLADASALCTNLTAAQCDGWWITLSYTMPSGYCRQLRQYVLRRSWLEHAQRGDDRFWRGERRWQSCSETSS